MKIWLVLLISQTAMLAQTQTDRGEAFFLDPVNGCASCHALKGKGTAAGPDLRDIARLSPKGIAMAIRSTVSQYVQVAKLKTGDAFPAYVAKVDDTTVTVWDLSKNPPEGHKVAKADVTTSSNQTWKHPPGVKKPTNEQMADVVAYIRFAGANLRTAVTPEEIQ